MRRLNLALLASLQLCHARQPSFSIHDDLLAHPQFEVVFGGDFITESAALSILESSRTREAASAAEASPSDLTSKARESAAAELPDTKASHGSSGASDDEDAPISETYELINNPPFRYLCTVPVIAPPPVLNRTATELAKAEEARELSRASAKGWEMMSGLEGQCMYFTLGWWSYSFCYGKEVVQYHAMPVRPGEAPTRDEGSLEYVLGRAPPPSVSKREADDPKRDGETTDLTPPNVQLQIKGDSRYLSQRLEDGTICDLTGRPRTVEIQYHCSPDATTDRIGWIKEVTTCTYLLVVYTPRLCSDVVFLPPKETRAHPIRCRPIASSDEEEALWLYSQRTEARNVLSPPGAKTGTKDGAAAAAAGGKVAQNYFAGTTIGGVVVGAKKLVSDDLAHKLPLPRGVTRQPAGEVVIGVIASKKQKGAKVERMSDEELKKLEIDPRAVEELREQMEQAAGDQGWRVQLVDVPGKGYEYLAAFGDEEEEGEGERKGGVTGEGDAQKQQQGRQGKQAPPSSGEKKAEKGKVGGGSGRAEKKEEEKEKGQEGSEEVFFKDEL